MSVVRGYGSGKVAGGGENPLYPQMFNRACVYVLAYTTGLLPYKNARVTLLLHKLRMDAAALDGVITDVDNTQSRC